MPTESVHVLQPALCGFYLYDPYRDLGTDTQHVDHLGVTLHLINAIMMLTKNTQGATEGERTMNRLSDAVADLRVCHGANIPSQGLNGQNILSKAR